MSNKETLTGQQQAAVDYRGLSAVVSASAGSGKTKVLVEHITKLITDANNKVYADEIAAVTFTEKAAAELKRKLKESIEKKLGEDPHNEFFMEQAARMNYAQISTISSFCFTLIMDNIRLLPLNDGATILDDAKAGILSKKAEKLMMKRFYTELKPEEQAGIFRCLGEEYEIIKAAKDLYGFLSNLPYPDKWKNEQIAVFSDPKRYEKDYIKPYQEDSEKIVGDAVKACKDLDQAVDTINDDLQKPDEFTKTGQESASQVIDSFKELKDILDNAVNAYQSGNYTEALTAISKDYGAIPHFWNTKGLKKHTEAKNNAVKAIESFTQVIAILSNCDRDREECLETLKKLYIVEELYEEEYSRLKKKENGLDFSDLEKYALKAVSQGAGKGKYNYIVVDEFQDSNDIQYEIFKKLADKKDDGHSDNEKSLYFVGDEKQCIYAFRNANPKIFTKLCQSPYYDNIKLTMNFRSSRCVLDTVNLLFSTKNKPKSFSENPWEDMSCGREPAACGENIGDENAPGEDIGEENVRVEDTDGENAWEENTDGENAWGEDTDNENTCGEDIDGENTEGENTGDENAEDEKVWDENVSELVKIFPDEKEKNRDLMYVAKRIKEMKESRFRIKGKDGERDCGYGDFAVLARTNKNLIRLRKIMEEMGIPAVSVGEKDFTGLMEVEQVLALLSAVIRPHDNISVAKALMSPAYGFSAEDIAKVRMAVGVEIKAEENKAPEEKAPQTEASGNNAADADTDAENEPHSAEICIEPDDVSLSDEEFETIIKEESESDGHENGYQHTEASENAVLDISDPVIRKYAGTKCLYANLNRMKNTGTEDPLHEKIDRFLTDIKLLREEARISGTAQLIRKIYSVTAMDQIMSVGKNGKERLANMRLLVHYGKRYPRPADFLTAMQTIKKSGLALSQAQIKEQEESSVKLMTIHASKGLQFPVVFLIDTNVSANTRDKYDKYIYEPERGVGIIVSDCEKLYSYHTVSHKLLENDYMDKVLGEEMRLLYVALTRAEEKLIVTALLKKPKKNNEKDMCASNSYYEFVFKRLEEFPENDRKRDMMFRVIEDKPCAAADDADIDEEEGEEIYDSDEWEDEDDWDYEEMFEDDEEWEEDDSEEDIYKRIRRNVTYEYPYRKLTETPAKFSATAIGVKAVKSEDETTAGGGFYFSTPLFLKNYKEKEKNTKIRLTAKEKGDIYHKIMEHTDFAAKSAEEELDRLVKEELIHEGEREAVDAEDIQSFLNSDLCKRAVSAEAVYREFPVFTTVNHAKIEDPSPEDLSFIQGIADMYFVEKGEIVLVDYKTNRYDKAKKTINGFVNELIEEYEGQLEIYSKALEEMTGLKVKECWLYSFSLQKAIKVECK